MANYNKITKITDLSTLPGLLSNAQVLLAHNKKNYKTSLDNINQTRIENIIQTETFEDNKPQLFEVVLKDGSSLVLGVFNGPQGDKGVQGEKGIRGDKGDAPALDYNRSEKYLMIVNDTDTDDADKVLSAQQGIEIENALKEMTETYMTDEKYQLLFRNMIFIDAEFISEEDNQEVLLFNADPAIHKLYLKYWTYESSGSTEYFVLNHFSGAYDSIYCDLWNDIYLGALEGYFEATSAQLSDGSPLYVNNGETYDLITVDGVGNRTFTYHLNDADCNVKVYWDKITKTYDYNLDASELALNVYAQIGSDEYKRILDKNDIDFSGFTMYYTLVNGEYVYIDNIEAFLEKKPLRYFKNESGLWVEVNSLDDIDTDSFEEYIVVEYDKGSNVNTFTHYTHVKTVRDEFYTSASESLNNFSITYYIYDDNRQYYTRRMVSSVGEDGNEVWDYEYTRINVPFWVEAEYLTINEDETILLIFNDIEKSEVETVDPIYLSSIEFEDNNIVLKKNTVKNIKLNYSPSNANIFDMTLEYDDSVITVFEDGRIAAVNSDEITTETSIKLTSKQNNRVSDTLRLKIVTPIEQINTNTNVINLYPGGSFQLNYTTVPEIVSDGSITWEASDNEMVNIDANGLVTPKKDDKGNYKTGTCTISAIANDGFGARKTIDVLIAIPVESIQINSKNYGFIGIKDKLNCIILPENATEQKLVYTSSDTSIIDIQPNGEYTPKAGGTVTLTATTTDGTNLSDSISVKVEVGVNSINVTGLDSKLDIGLTNDYEVEVLPENADNKRILMNVSDTSVVEYSTPQLVEGTTNKYTGYVKAIASGSTTISFIAEDGTNVYSSNDMLITVPVKDMNFDGYVDKFNMSGFVGDIIPMKIIYGEDNPSVQEVTWNSSNLSVATIDANGRISCRAEGKTIISATSKDSAAVTISILLSVSVKTEEIILHDGSENITIILDNTDYIMAEVKPADTTNQILKWISSDPEIVEVEDNGLIRAKKLGEAIITVTSTDGSNVSKTISVTVVDKIVEEAPEEQPNE
jgi:uncharacterized protein YjdB